MLSSIDRFYLSQEEPLKSCWMVLRDIILGFDGNISESWKYGMPFFLYKQKILCYFWLDIKDNKPYVGIIEGWRIEHPLLVQGKRKRIKVFYIDPNVDLPVKQIHRILKLAMSFYH